MANAVTHSASFVRPPCLSLPPTAVRDDVCGGHVSRSFEPSATACESSVCSYSNMMTRMLGHGGTPCSSFQRSNLQFAGYGCYGSGSKISAVGRTHGKYGMAERERGPRASSKESGKLEESDRSVRKNDLDYAKILSGNESIKTISHGRSSFEEGPVPIMSLADAGSQSDGGSQPSSSRGEGMKAKLEDAWLNLVETTEVAIDRVPGPRVGPTQVPWLVAVPLAYAGVSLVLAIVRLYQKGKTPRAKRKNQLSKNQALNDALNAFFPTRRSEFSEVELRKIQRKTGFSDEEVLRKHVRYTLNERPFNPDLVADLLHLRKVSGLSDDDVAEVLNDVARRIVKAKGAVMMNTQGMTEKGIKRKAAVQALFSKVLYLSELEEFCSSQSRNKLQIKPIFGVTDEDTEGIRIDTLSEASDMDALEMMVNPPSTSDLDNDQGR